MTPFYVHTVYDLASHLGVIQGATVENFRLSRTQALLRVPDDVRPHLDNLARLCRDAELPVSARLVERQIEAANAAGEMPATTWAGMIQELNRRVADELEQVLFIRVRADARQFYANSALFGEAVAARFPEAAFDVEESGSCLALARYTASVFHVMRVMEVLLRAVARDLQIPEAVKEAERNWGAVLRAIRKQVDGMPQGERRAFFEEVHAHLSTVKNAWRNPVMHVEGKHDEHEARRIFNAVRDFATHLATGLGAASPP